MNRFAIMFFALMLTFHTYGQSLTMWYDKPGQRWEESLPLGNGQIGMMPNGGITDEQIVLNEISLWSGGVQDPNNYEAHKSVDEIQQLLFAGKNDEAELLVNRNFVCSGAGSGHGNGADVPYGCFQNFGFLNIHHFVEGDVLHYRRQLDLETAIGQTIFTVGNTEYKREYFTSHDQNIGVIRLSATEKQSIGFALHFYRDERITDYRMQHGEISFSGVLPNGTGGVGMQFAGQIKIVAEGGTEQQYDNQLIVKNADEVLIYVALSTDYYRHDPAQVVKNALTKSARWRYSSLRKNHVKAYQKHFNKVRLKIADQQDKTGIPTDIRIANFYQNPVQDNGLATLYYQFGRYLTLSSTAPHVEHALPPNLQGLWAHQIQTPWNGDYHLNVNAQMNHWGVEVGNLSQHHKPFLELIKRIAKEGEKTARAYYNAPGWVAYMMTNVWGYTAPGEHASWGASTASGWLCNHLWEHFQFSQDKDYLREVYPILKGAAEFYKATLVRDPKTGWLVTSPSVSPENGFELPSGKRASVVMGPTIDNQIVRELYMAVIESNNILELYDDFAQELQRDLAQLPPPVQVSASGRVMEWLEDYKEIEPTHRHVSHLYGLYPAAFISPLHTPEWSDAARTSLNVRGDEGTGWSRAWKVLFWARLHDGDRALEILRQLFRPAFAEDGKVQAGTYPNLFCAHPPFQIDGNFGGAAGIAEMLLQSHDDLIHLLPALPHNWQEGEVKGLKARGDITVDFKWRNGQVYDYSVRGEKDKKVKVLCNGQTDFVRL